MKKKVGLLIVLIGLLGIVIILGNDVKIVDFDSCVAEGNPIMESYPRQCREKFNGKIFVESIEEEWKSDGIILMQNEVENFFGCFGCGKEICIDPVPEMKRINETKEMYCDSNFKIIRGKK